MPREWMMEFVDVNIHDRDQGIFDQEGDVGTHLDQVVLKLHTAFLNLLVIEIDEIMADLVADMTPRLETAAKSFREQRVHLRQKGRNLIRFEDLGQGINEPDIVAQGEHPEGRGEVGPERLVRVD
jgi:hypothetical protein